MFAQPSCAVTRVNTVLNQFNVDLSSYSELSAKHRLTTGLFVIVNAE